VEESNLIGRSMSQQELTGSRASAPPSLCTKCAPPQTGHRRVLLSFSTSASRVTLEPGIDPRSDALSNAARTNRPGNGGTPQMGHFAVATRLARCTRWSRPLVPCVRSAVAGYVRVAPDSGVQSAAVKGRATSPSSTLGVCTGRPRPGRWALACGGQRSGCGR
jgi:hypothetical protein